MRRRRGIILMVVLVVTALASMVAASLLFRMRAETSASVGCERGEQAYQAAMSGIQRAVCVLKSAMNDSTVWTDNSDLFYGQLVCDDGANQWYYTVFADNPADTTTVRYGVEDLAGKININVADESTLLAMPNMTADLVDCLIDYRDADNTPRAQGAEQDYYSALPQPYKIRNGPFFTLEELLLVKGFNGQIVFGEDADMNGILAPNKDDGDTSFPPDAADGQLDTGLRGVATTFTYELNKSNDGNARVNMNGDPRLSKLGLPAQTLKFITAYLADGNKFKNPAELLEMKYTPKNSGKDSNSPAGVPLDSGITGKELPLVMDKLTAGAAISFGLVNVNTAPLRVLSILPGMDEAVAQRIIDARSEVDSDTRRNLAWLYTSGAVDAETFKKIAPCLTTRSFQYHIKCVGYGLPSGRYRTMEAVVDFARGGVPRVMYQRDITRLGQPFAFSADTQETVK